MIAADFDGDGRVDLASTTAAMVNRMFGFRAPCGQVHDPWSFVPYHHCVLCPVEGGRQSILCASNAFVSCPMLATAGLGSRSNQARISEP